MSDKNIWRENRAVKLGTWLSSARSQIDLLSGFPVERQAGGATQALHRLPGVALSKLSNKTTTIQFNVLKGFLELVLYQQYVQQYEQYVFRPDVHDRVARAGLQLLKPGAGERTRNNLEIYNFAEEYFDNIFDKQ